MKIRIKNIEPRILLKMTYGFEAVVTVNNREYICLFNSNFDFHWMPWQMPEEIKIKAETEIKGFH